MTIIPHDSSTGTWVRLRRRGVTLAVERWPGPHHPGTVIHTTGGGRFVCSHLDPDADGGPEAVYDWTDT
jgi:hypothetical protein